MNLTVCPAPTPGAAWMTLRPSRFCLATQAAMKAGSTTVASTISGPYVVVNSVTSGRVSGVAVIERTMKTTTVMIAQPHSTPTAISARVRTFSVTSPAL